jgi:hypothetical protein
MDEYSEIIVLLEQVIVKYAGSLTSIRDRDILESVRLLKKTYKTESRGIIYEETSSNPLAQALVQEMRDTLEQMRAKGASEGLQFAASAAMSCLEVIEADVLYYLKSDEEGVDYLNFISRNHPEAATPSKQNGLIIAP